MSSFIWGFLHNHSQLVHNVWHYTNNIGSLQTALKPVQWQEGTTYLCLTMLSLVFSRDEGLGLCLLCLKVVANYTTAKLGPKPLSQAGVSLSDKRRRVKRGQGAEATLLHEWITAIHCTKIVS